MDHFANKKDQLDSEYDNKRYTLNKHQDLEIDLYNDDTNPLYYSKSEYSYFKDLRGHPYIEKSLDEVPIPDQILKTCQCVVGEGRQLENFENLKYVINLRDSLPYKTRNNAEHKKMVGALLPFKDKQLDSVVIYNYLELLPEYYRLKIFSEALRVAKEVFVFSSSLSAISSQLGSFASRTVVFEWHYESLLESKGFARIYNKESKSKYPPVNIILSTYEELNLNPNLIKLAQLMDKIGFDVNIFAVQFNFRYAFENKSLLFKQYSGFIYERLWGYISAENVNCINIHTNRDEHSHFGVNLIITSDSFIFLTVKPDFYIKEINKSFDAVLLPNKDLKTKLSSMGLQIPIIEADFLSINNRFDMSVFVPEFAYMVSDLSDETIGNLRIWLDAFVKLYKLNGNIKFKILFPMDYAAFFLQTNLSGYRFNDLWGKYVSQQMQFNNNGCDRMNILEKKIIGLISEYLTTIKSTSMVNSTESPIIYELASIIGDAIYIGHGLPNSKKFINNTNKITRAAAYTLMSKKLMTLKAQKPIRSFLEVIKRFGAKSKSQKVELENVWGFLRENNFMEYCKAFEKLPDKNSLEACIARSIYLLLVGQKNQAIEMFDSIAIAKVREKWLEELYFSWYGYALALTGKKSESYGMFQKCLSINPMNLIALVNSQSLKDSE